MKKRYAKPKIKRIRLTNGEMVLSQCKGTHPSQPGPGFAPPMCSTPSGMHQCYGVNDS